MPETIERFLEQNAFKSRTFLEADINSDHDLVMMTMNLKLKKNLRNHGPRLKFNFEKLKDPHVADLFEAANGTKWSVHILRIHTN